MQRAITDREHAQAECSARARAQRRGLTRPSSAALPVRRGRSSDRCQREHDVHAGAVAGEGDRHVLAPAGLERVDRSLVAEVDIITITDKNKAPARVNLDNILFK